MKKTFIRVVAAILVLVTFASIVFMFTGCQDLTPDRVEKDPETQLRESIQATKAAVQKGREVSPFYALSAAVKQGSVEFAVRGNDQALINKFYADAKNDKYADYIITEMGRESQAIKLYRDGTKIAIDAESYLPDGALQFDLKTLGDDLKASGILDQLGISYDDIAEVVNDLTEMASDKQPQSIKELYAFWKELKTALHQGYVGTSSQKILVGMSAATMLDVKYSLTTEQLTQVIDLVAKKVKETEDPTLSEIYKAITESGTDFDEIITELKKVIANMKMALAFDVYINPETETIAKAEVVIKTEQEEHVYKTTLSLELGVNPATSGLYKLRLANLDDTGEETAITVSYEWKRDESGYKSTFAIESNGVEELDTVKVAFDWDKNNYLYTLKAMVGKEIVTLDGKMTFDDKKIDLTAKYIQGTSRTNFTLKAELGTEVPEFRAEK